MSGGHHHHHHHGHSHAPDWSRAFALGIGLNLAFILVEVVAGILANSLALLADAGHNVSDVLGLALAWIAAYLGRRGPTDRRTYGFGRSSVFAALINAVVLLVAMGAIAWEAIHRLGSPAEVAGWTVGAVAAAGVVINGATALLFRRGSHDLNIRGAYLHMAADAAVSAGVVVSGLAIAATGLLWLDPAASLAIVVVIVVGTWRLLRESLDLAMDAVPAGIDHDAVEAYLRWVPGVTEVHDLHIWALSTTETALTCHLVRPGAAVDDALLMCCAEELRARFGIGHATFQVEHGSEVCALAPEHVV